MITARLGRTFFCDEHTMCLSITITWCNHAFIALATEDALTNPLLPILTKFQAELAAIIANLDDSFTISEAEETRRVLVTMDDVMSEADHMLHAALQTVGISDHKNHVWDHYHDDPRTSLTILLDKQRDDEEWADSPEGIAASRSDDLHNRRMEA